MHQEAEKRVCTFIYLGFLEQKHLKSCKEILQRSYQWTTKVENFKSTKKQNGEFHFFTSLSEESKCYNGKTKTPGELLRSEITYQPKHRFFINTLPSCMNIHQCT